MKKNIIYLLLIATALVFNACGSNNKEDPIAPIPPAPIDIYDFSAVPEEINITKAGEVRVLDLYLSDKSTHKWVADKIIIANVFDPSNGTLDKYTATTDVNGHVAFSYTAPETFTVGDTFDITFEVEGSVPALTKNITVNFVNVNTSPPVNSANYSLIAVPSDINISADDTSRVLDLYLEDTSVSAPVAGQVITAQFIDPNNGTLDKYTATTDVNGHVAFEYTRPETFTVGDTFDITFEVAGGTVPKSATVGVTFVAVSALDTSNYSLIAVPSDINISADDTSRVLDLYLEDTSVSAPVAGQVITAQFIDPNNGTLDKYTATTDVNGHVAFEYTRPETFTVGDTFDITFEVAGGTVPKSATVGVTFVDVYTAPPVDTTNYSLIAVPSDINISADDTSRVLDLYLEDTSVSAPVAGQVITAQFIDPNNGTLDKYTATTDVNGHVAFEYTRPETFTVGDTFDITFEVAGGTVPKSATVGVTFVDVYTAPPVDTTNYSLIAVPSDINISADDTSRVLDLYLEDTSVSAPVAGQVITAQFIDPNNGTLDKYTATTDVNGHVAFEYTRPETFTVGDTFDITFEVAGGTVPKSATVGVTFVAVSALDTSNYSLIAVPSDINISADDTSRVLDLYLEDTSVSAPVAGQVITAQFIDPNNGTLDKYTATTDVNGHVAFEYTRPETFTVGDTFDITFEVAGGTVPKSATVGVTFVDVYTAPPVDTTNYSLIAVPSDINISADDTSRVLDLYLEDTSVSAPVAGQVITAQFIDPNNGTLDKYTATTDVNGHVAFEYTRPETFTVGDTFDITFEVAGGTVPKSATVGVTFVDVYTAPPVDTTNYSLIAVPSDINISADDTSRVLDLYLEDTSVSAPVAGQVITAQFIDPNNGTLDKYTATTDVNGHVAFEYTRPETFTVGDTFDITFEVAGGTVPKSATVGVTFVAVSALDTSNYSLIAVPSDINISADDTSRVLDLYLEDTSVSAPVAGQVITAQFIDPNNGTLDKYTATTDVNGHVAFEYTRPETFTVGDTFDITFEVAGGTVPKSATVGVTFVDVNFDSATYTITADKNITVTDLGTEYSMNVALMKQEIGGVLQPAVGQKVIAEFIMPVNGILEQYEVDVDSSGIATFKYTSPDRNLPTSDANITFYYENDHTVTAKTLLIFDPQVIDTVSDMYVTPLSFTVTAPGEEQDITIVTVNSQNVGISTTVTLEQPHNGTDYGTFDMTNVVTNTSGYAVVKYTAPSDITGLEERNITVTELSQNISQELNIVFNTPTNNAKYEILADIPGSFTVDTSDKFGIKIVEVGNQTNVIDDVNVHEVNLTSKFTNMLVFENGTDETTYMQLGDNPNIGIISKTLAGVAIIEVRASIFDGTNDIVITASVPVTIISGPVTALSIPYVSTVVCSSEPNLWANVHLIHAVDRYSNPAQVRITPTLINGTKVIVAGPSDGTGTIGYSGVTEFTDTSTLPFGSVIAKEDRLIVVPNTNHHDFSYLGNWTINDASSDTLTLDEEYTGVVASNLSYIVGNEYRLMDDGRDIAIAHVYDPTGEYMTDANGTLALEVCWDPKLAGHTFTLGAYAQDNNRTGIATIESFRWSDYSSEVAVVDNNNTTYNISLGLGISGGINEHLIDVDISPSSVIVEKSLHCTIDYANSDFHTDGFGQIEIVLNTDGNQSATGGVDTCTVEWNANPGSILYEY